MGDPLSLDRQAMATFHIFNVEGQINHRHDAIAKLFPNHVFQGGQGRIPLQHLQKSGGLSGGGGGLAVEQDRHLQLISPREGHGKGTRAIGPMESWGGGLRGWLPNRESLTQQQFHSHPHPERHYKPPQGFSIHPAGQSTPQGPACDGA